MKTYLSLSDDLIKKLMMDYGQGNITHEQFIQISRGITKLLDSMIMRELNA